MKFRADFGEILIEGEPRMFGDNLLLIMMNKSSSRGEPSHLQSKTFLSKCS